MTATPAPTTGGSARRGPLTRSQDDRWFGGVCGGLAARFGLDPGLVRLAVTVLTVLGFGSVIVLYLVAWVVLPLKLETR